MDELGEAAQKFTNVFVKNLPEEVDDAALHTMFSEFGEVTSAAVSTDTEGKARGFGFVSFGNTDAAHKVLSPYVHWLARAHLLSHAHVTSSFGITSLSSYFVIIPSLFFTRSLKLYRRCFSFM